MFQGRSPAKPALAEQNYLAPGFSRYRRWRGLPWLAVKARSSKMSTAIAFSIWVAGIGVASIGHGHKALAQALSQQTREHCCDQLYVAGPTGIARAHRRAYATSA